jgi:DUF1680 family protein
MSEPIVPRTVILDTSHSPYARFQPVALDRIVFKEGFWSPRQTINRTVTIPSQYQLLETTGRLDNFRRVHGEVQKPFQGLFFNDSDVYKWLEAACWAMAGQHGSEISEKIDKVIKIIANAQDKDGYLNTYFSLEKIRQRWTNLKDYHELYCAGHLLQAAIAHHRVTGNYRLLNIALGMADHICRTFGQSQVEGTSGHPEIEMALVELYRTTGEIKYLKQSALFIDRRGRGLVGGSEYLLDHVPFRKMEHLVGHAVRALYLCCGAADLELETGEDLLRQTLTRLWDRLVTQQMYITGGVGARYEGEAIGMPFELPNARAYAETCAAIANVMWNWRMLQREIDARYADLIEWAFYNAVLPGISLDAQEYFYVNPLQDNGTQRRNAWFECACCPPNIARVIAAFPGYMYSISKEGIWLHLFAQSTATLDLFSGPQVILEQTTSYPWDGKVQLVIKDIISTDSVDANRTVYPPFSLYIRIPGWLESSPVPVRLNGRVYRHHASPGSYLQIYRQWEPGDRVDLELLMEARFITSHPMVAENHHRMAITRGPLVYCMEAIDNPRVNLATINIDPMAPLEAEFVPSLLGGMTRLHVHASATPINRGWNHRLYREASSIKGHPKHHETELISIPYFAWANRQPGAMVIWQLFR